MITQRGFTVWGIRVTFLNLIAIAGWMIVIWAFFIMVAFA